MKVYIIHNKIYHGVAINSDSRLLGVYANKESAEQRIQELEEPKRFHPIEYEVIEMVKKK